MIKRRKTTTVKVGSGRIGSKWPVVIQTMTKTATTDIGKCLRQVKQLAKEGAGLVRIAVPTKDDTEALAKIIDKAPVPIIADVHFSKARAIEAIEAGAAKIRLNPGNIKDRKDILAIIDCAKAHKIAIRIGVNEASIRDIKTNDTTTDKRVGLMLREMTKYVKLFEKAGFDNIVLSAKSADAVRTIEINKKLAEKFPYPLHLGLTHAGLPADAIVASAVTVGGLLSCGIGDTIRISMAGDPAKEVQIAKKILEPLGLYQNSGPKLIVCPTCGRCQIEVVKLAEKVKKALNNIKAPLHIAVMGCVVNGPGEAADADIAICAAKGKGFIYRGGKKVAVVAEQKLISVMIEEIKKIST